MPQPARPRARPGVPNADAGESKSGQSLVESGQSLVEFALLIPLFFVLLMGLIEFAFAFNAMLNTNYASRGAGLVAAQAGNASAADCFILNEIDLKMNAPAERRQIGQIDIQRTNPSGTTVYASSAYRRSGSMSCTLTDGSTMSVPYSSISNGYPPSQRCTVLPPAGCVTMTPVRTTVDTIAVQITYVYPWHTPLRSLLPLVNGSLSGSGFIFVQRNVFRMEPTL
jgi:Flp pilus assembly protein TadG